MVKVGKWIAKNRIIILILAILSLIPCVWSYAHTRTNYDVLTYLPKNLETVKGQDILVDEYGMGGFAMVVVDNESLSDVAALEKDIEGIDHVADVIWYDDVADISVPVNMIPEKLRTKFFNGDATMMIALLDDGTSTDNSMDAVENIRKVVNKDCYVNSMSAILMDLKNLSDSEVPIYVTIAVVLCLIALEIFATSWITPFLFLVSIGFAIIWNMGTNMVFGEISYITKAIAAVLQLGVTTDYSIFLLNSYEENKVRFPDDKNRAMGHAISNTFQSIMGSSVTTIAGFIALCFMTFTLGRDLGLVMAKGVLFGVLACITVLPALVLFFDKAIDRTAHRPLIRSVDGVSAFITKHYKVWLVLFLILLVPAFWGNNHGKTYYDMSNSLPDTLDSKVAAQKVMDEFDTGTMEIAMFDKNLSAKEKSEMLTAMDDVDGVTYCMGINSLVSPTVPESMIPDDLRDMLQSKNYEIAFISSKYHVASDEVNDQITALSKISLPVILELVIEFAIWVNMSISTYAGTELVFIAGIIIGTVQLGSTVDYAILMTSRYQKERQRGKDKKEAVTTAHKATMLSIITSGVAFFSATFGVYLYSNIDVVKSICMLLARGALISTVVVIFILPGMFMIFDGLITHTTLDFFGTKKAALKEKLAKN